MHKDSQNTKLGVCLSVFINVCKFVFLDRPNIEGSHPLLTEGSKADGYCPELNLKP